MNDLFPAGPRLIRVIDYETTGFTEDEKAEVIELGRIDVDLESHEVLNPWSALARPVGLIPPETKAVHHICEADVAEAPLIGHLWRGFFDGCTTDDVMAAHNAAFERHFHKGNGREWICTLKVARVMWPDAPSHSNQVLRYWLNLDANPAFDPARAMPAHRALPDAYVTAHLLVLMLENYTVDQMIAISKQPSLLRRLNFGKHRGETFEECPLGYLHWIMEQDFDADVTHSARTWIDQRANG